MTQIKAEYINHMGDDLTVVNAARVSFDKESEFHWYEDGTLDGVLKQQDKTLINYLATHNHWTPFSHPQITLRETVPIFVARQRFKHMVGFTYNEVSRRYVDDMPEFYVPDEWHGRPDGSIKQGRDEGYKIHKIPCDIGYGSIVTLYDAFIDEAVSLYTDMIEGGVAPEQARMILPQSMMTSYYVTGSLAAFARAYKQRIDPHSQKEIQGLAKQWGDIIKPLYPVSWEALTNGQ